MIPLFICYLSLGFSIYSVILRVFNYTDEEVNNWLVSFVVCFLVSFVLVYPLQIVLKILIRVAFTGQIQRKKSIDDLFDENAPIKSNDSLFTKHKQFNLDPLDSYKIEKARDARLKSLKIKKMFKEGIVYILFMISLSYVSYSTDVNLSYQYKSSMQELFSLDKNFPNIKKLDDFWSWLDTDLLRNIRAEKWYNDQQPIGLAGFLNDKNSRIIGYSLVRQLRVKSNSCSVHERFKKLIHFCTNDYSATLEDQKIYSVSWNEYDSSVEPTPRLARVFSAFNYRNASDLNGYPFDGEYNTYQGGGYVYEMRGSLSFIRSNLTMLTKSGWLDRRSRGLFIEFSVFNPNINMLAVCQFLLEILPSGSILTSSRIDPFVLFQRDDNSGLIANIFSFIFVTFIILFILRETLLLIKQCREYIGFWNLIEWLIILSAVIAIYIYIYRLYESFKVLDFFRETSGYGYYKLQYVTLWNEALRYSLAFCICLSTLKLLKFLSFNKIIAFLSLTIKLSSKELMSFTFIFSILWLAFVQLMYICLQDKIIEFSTILNSMSSCFQIMLGTFNVTKILDSDQYMGPLIFAFYNIFITFILLNIFVTIISETFTNIRKNDKKNEYYIDIAKEIKENINYLLSPGDKNIELLKIDRKDDDQEEYMKYVNYVDYFPYKIDQLLDRVNKVIFHFLNKKISKLICLALFKDVCCTTRIFI
jgi:polycystin 1L2